MPAPRMPLSLACTFRFSAPSSTRATSFMVTTEPSVAALSTMSSNWSTVLSLVRAVIVALSCWLFTAGSAPSWPAETWAFCALSALAKSDGISPNFSILAGSIQMRIAYEVPKTLMSPTPSRRPITSTRLALM